MKSELGRVFLKKKKILSGINDKYMSDRWNKPKKTRKIAFMMIYGDFISVRPVSTTLTLMY